MLTKTVFKVKITLLNVFGTNKCLFFEKEDEEINDRKALSKICNIKYKKY